MIHIPTAATMMGHKGQTTAKLEETAGQLAPGLNITQQPQYVPPPGPPSVYAAHHQEPMLPPAPVQSKALLVYQSTNVSNIALPN